MNRSSAKIKIVIWSFVAVLTIAAIGAGVFFSGNPMGRLWGSWKPYQVIQELELEEPESVEIRWLSGGGGDVNLLKSTDGKVHLVLKATRLLPEKKPISYTVSDGTLMVEGNIRSNTFFLFSGTRVLLEVYLPDKEYEELEFKNGSGAFTGDGLRAKTLEGENSSGSMRLSGAFSKVALENSSGEMQCDNSAGTSLEAENQSGNTTVSGFYEELELKTSSGVLHAENKAPARLKTKTVSGDLKATGSFTELDNSVSSGSTRIVSAELPQSISGDITSGKLRYSFPEDEKGFRAEVDKQSGSFSCQFTVQRSGRTYTYKNGQGDYRFKIGSGTLFLDKN